MHKRILVGFIYYYLSHTKLYYFLKSIDSKIRKYIGMCQHGCEHCACLKCGVRTKNTPYIGKWKNSYKVSYELKKLSNSIKKAEADNK
jgi:hypothetical protein